MVLVVKYRPTRSKRWADQRHNRRIIQEYGLQEAQRTGFLDLDKNNKKKKQRKNKSKKPTKTKEEKWQIFETKASKTGLHIGLEYESKYKEFIASGGDPNSCPFG